LPGRELKVSAKDELCRLITRKLLTSIKSNGA
jgi:hypothetical protein